MNNRGISRSHVVLDHGLEDGLDGFYSVLGGKLTTYRHMAEETVDLICHSLGNTQSCQTQTTLLEPPKKKHFQLCNRLTQFDKRRDTQIHDPILCECELVTQSMLVSRLQNQEKITLDDLRRDTRLGMGPCQGAFCAYRAAALISAHSPKPDMDGGYSAYVQERWRGQIKLGWESRLRQMEITRRIAMEILCAENGVDNPA
jgi:glycerol-3-phosphate dehydrogenase